MSIENLKPHEGRYKRRIQDESQFVYWQLYNCGSNYMKTMTPLSWFKLYTATSVDLVFILLPIFEEARMMKGDDLRKFMQLDEILLIDGYPRYQQLLSIAENCMQIVCQGKGDPKIGSSKNFRLDDSRLWLGCTTS
ncbi:hypothetical protein UlMin_006527 [Ulmus minor]